MAFKFVVLATLLACVNAGGLIAGPAVATYSAAPAVSSSYIHQASPVAVGHAAPVLSAYAASPVAIHAPAYGQTYQNVERSLGGAQSVSHYSKAVDSAFSSVRKYDTRFTNDALSVAHAPVVSAYSAPVYAKAAYSAGPAVSSSYIQKTAPYATYAQAAPVATYAHAAPVAYAAQATYAHAAPVATYAHAAPVATYAHAAPVAYAAQATYAHAAPVATYAHAAPVATYAHAAPVATYAHAAPVATYAHAAPVATYSAGPVVAKAALSYSPATVVSHTSFSGLGAAYQW